MITKEEVLKAIEIIERYKIQQSQIVDKLEEKIIENTNTKSINQLGLSPKSIKCLWSIDVFTIGELLNIHPNGLRCVRYLGRKSIIDINKALEEKGFDKIFALPL
jgi:DNA-directed RNA polymerase alpha subunit